jgi:hypothetical protein
VPRSGQRAIDTTGQPSVTISYDIEQPSVAITAPADGATYAQGRRVRAAYACRQSPLLLRARIVSCAGTVAVGRRIDTRSLGDHAFTVTARDQLGITAVTTVHYSVTDQTRPQIRRLGIVRRSLSLSDRRPTANVHFLLSEPARVVVRVGRAAPSAARPARARARILSARRGWNRFELRPRIGRRTLPPGDYRLTLVAIDQAGNRSRPAQRVFHVIE